MFAPCGPSPRGRWRVYNGTVFFAGWSDNATGVVVAGTWRNAWATDDLEHAEAVRDALNARGPKHWGVTRYQGR